MRAFLPMVGAALLAFTPLTTTAADIDLPYEQFTLNNGLRVVVHEDHKAPLVAVSIWYHVGSKDEPAGKTGFAHLFEHIMFNGSENFDNDWFGPLEEVGATGLNGTTWFDRTNYFQTVPKTALEMVLWMESDRMGHLLGALTQEKLDEQRGVVQNEKRQGDNQPYGMMEYSTLAGLLPASHPYRHSTIGSMEDLQNASLDTAKQWFKDYYGAANAVLVLAGDVDTATAKTLVEKYFGDIPAGPPVTQTKTNAPQLDVNKREIMFDRVPQPRLDRNWVAPGRVTREAVLLDLAAQVLGGGKTSRLYKKLIDEKQIATSATANNQTQELMSFYSVTVDAKADADRTEVEREMESVLAEFLAKGPTAAELSRAKTGIKADLLRGLEEIGGFGGKATALAQGALYANDPGFILKQLDWLEAATPKEVLAVARDVMSAGYYQLDVLPFPEYSTTASTVDRSTGIPTVTATPDLAFPAIEEATLRNGMKVVLAERHTMPLVEMSIQFDAGYAADSVEGGKLGASSFTASMLDEGTTRRSAGQIAEQLEALGANLGAGANLDVNSVQMSALKENLRPSLDIMADVIRNPAFSQTEIDKLRSRWLAAIEQEKAAPVQLALRLLPPQIYGEGHAYAVPFTGSGTVSSINSLTRADLTSFHSKWMRPDNATFFIVGDTTMAEIKPLLETAFDRWDAPSEPKPVKNVTNVDRPAKGKVILVDKPGSPQSLILAAHVAPSSSADNEIAINAMNDIIGGQFSARVNMNLREDKGWAYGAYTFLQGAKGQRPFMVYAPVQTDKTKESLQELLKELNAFKGAKPANPQELQRTVLNNVRSLPGSFETSNDVLGSLTSSARYGRPWNYPATVKDKYEALSITDITSAADEVIHPESLVWVIVGDREQIEAGVASLHLGPITIMSASDL
ncbi:M16 family metallopeptidase [Hyphococcus sp.]|uniref:M16 family metallopeptidase n=1 Tax=Hyphococcus sp. TaxID=2038636 RepID=UPI002083F158|nr:MAG: zinc protease [Marinicaulis sp.]